MDSISIYLDRTPWANMTFVSTLIIGNALVLEWKYTATVRYETRNGCASILYIEVKIYNILISRLVSLNIRNKEFLSRNLWLPFNFLKIDPASVVSVLPVHDENNLHPESLVVKTKLQAPFSSHVCLHCFSALFRFSNIWCSALHIHNWLAAITLYPSPAKI